MARKYFSEIINIFRSFISRVLSLPRILKVQFTRMIEDFKKLRYKLNNLAESNLDLGVYHLRCRNYNDAIFRFKLVDKFLEPGNKLANYWLGWVYFMKQDYNKSIVCLTKAGEEVDAVGLLPFVKSIDNISFIPPKIHAMHRDIIADIIVDKYISAEENIVLDLVSEFNDKAQNLPEEYNILELGANIGMLGDEIYKRMQETYILTGVEISDKMVELQPKCFPDINPYNRMINASIEEFLEQEKNKYNVVYSMDGFAVNSDLKRIFTRIFSILEPSGYFAFAIKTDKQNKLLAGLLEFAYNKEYVSNTLIASGFKILSDQVFALEIKNNYSIFVCTK